MKQLHRHSAPKMGRETNYKHSIAKLRKNSCERLHVDLTEYNNMNLLNLSVQRDSTGKHRVGKMKHTARYISIQVHQLPDLIEALQQAEIKARDIGVLSAGQSAGRGGR